MTKRGRFRRRLTVVAIGLAIVPLAVVAGLLISLNARALEASNRELLYSVIDSVAQQVDRAVGDPSVTLAAVAGTLGDADLDPKLRVLAAKHLVASSRALRFAGVYDDHGARIDVVRDAGVTTALPETLPEALRPHTDAPLLGPVERGEGGLVLPLVVAVKLPETTWYAYTTVDLSGLDEIVATAAAGSLSDEPGAVFVVDRAQRIIADGDPEHGRALQRSELAILAGLAAAPNEQYLAFSSYDGPLGPMIGAVRSLPSLPFVIVAQLPEARAYAAAHRMRIVVVIVLAIAIVLAAALALWLARRISTPVQQLVSAAADLAARKFDRPIAVKTGDELELLGDAMSDAARALARSEDDLRQEVTIRADLGRYLPRQLVDRIVDRTQDLALGGQRREVTVLFADVASFSSLVDQHPPEAVVTILNQLFTILTEVVFRHGGTVDKFVGDCVMAFWNAPHDQGDHARRAVDAAVDMMRWVETANEAWRAEHGVTVRLAIGVNTGEAVVGNFGSEQRMDYTCMGSAVSLAARLESMARPSQILISQMTHEAAGAAYDFYAIGPHAIVNRLEPVELFEVTA